MGGFDNTLSRLGLPFWVLMSQSLSATVIVAQLAEESLWMPEAHGSNQVIGKTL